MRKFLMGVAAFLPLLETVPTGAAEIAAGGAESVSAGAAYVPSAENMEARTEFQDAKFGIFLHWGLYSMLCQRFLSARFRCRGMGVGD